MMTIGNFQEAVQWVLAHGYLLMFIAMLLEGPLVTAAAAFAAAFGYFNVFIVLLLSVAGDFVTDVIAYALGYLGRFHLIERYYQYRGLTQERVAKIELLMKKQAVKGLVIFKLLPVVPFVALLSAGAVRMPLRKFLSVTLAVIVPKSILFIILGYYFGAAYTAFSRYLNYGIYLGLGIFLILISFYYGYRQLSQKLAEEIEKV